MTLDSLRAAACFLVFLLTSAGIFAQAPYTQQNTDLPCINRTFSLRVHTTFTPLGPPVFDRAVFEGMVDLANEAFAPICLRFEVCEYLEIENYRYHNHENNDAAERKNLYGDPNRIDVFVPNVDTLDGVCGRASFTGINRNAESTVMVVNGCIDSASYVLTHELGHYFGLYHTFERSLGLELVDSSNCLVAGDLVCDTPADPYVVGSGIQYVSIDNPCRYNNGGLRDANSEVYKPHTANVMSYYPVSCTRGFTRGQLQRMADIYLGGPQNVW